MNATASLTAEVVSAYLRHNPVPQGQLSALIKTVHDALVNIDAPAPAAPAEPLVKPCSVKASIQPGYLICMEDGKRYKSMKRTLRVHGLTPDQYRAKWGLPHDYPMVCSDYSAARSALAKQMGLGVGGRGGVGLLGKTRGAGPA